MATKEKAQLTYNEDELVKAIEELLKPLREHKLVTLYPSIDYATMHAEGTIRKLKERKGIK